MLLFDPATTLLALALALILDRLIGDPPWLWARLPHPVVLIGRLAEALEDRLRRSDDQPRRQVAAGGVLTLVVVGIALALGASLQAALEPWPGGAVALGLLISTLIADRSLHEHVQAVATGLAVGLDEGRSAVRHIVGRDPESLDEAAVARAAIESTAENFSDGVVAPVLFALAFGLPGILAYKAINTLDSMIGHRNARYLHFGRVAARLDDALNWPAARLAGVLIVLAGGRGPEAWRTMVRDAGKHRSPNAGWPEAAIAGALGLRLAGPRHYGGSVVEDAWMGAGRAEATARDVDRALARIRRAWWLMTAPLGLLALGL